MTSTPRFALFAVPVLMAAGVANAQLAVNWSTIDGGGGISSGGAFAISGTIGQPDASNAVTGGTFSVTGGFWAFATGNTPACLPDYNADGLLNTDDISDFITDYFTTPPVPGGQGPGGYAIPCLGAPAPYNLVGYKVDINQDCLVNTDDISDYITAYFQGC